MYTSHQNEKKTEYGLRAREVEKATLTAAVMSTSGGMGKEMDLDLDLRTTASSC